MGGNLTIAVLENYIEHYLTPFDIRRVLLDIGWQNYTLGTIPNEEWVSNWLSACDLTGVQNVIYVGQLTNEGVGSPWIRSVISLDRTIQTYAANGSAVSFVSYDSPNVAVYLEKDVSLIYSYYGGHTSWMGIGTGSTQDDPYYEAGQLFPGLGYSNSSISNFVNSQYYSSDVNATGFLPNGRIDPLWSAYRDVPPSISLVSGEGFTTSSAAKVYGNGSSSSYTLMRFRLQGNVTKLTLSWYGDKIGNPGPLVAQIFPDANGTEVDSKIVGSISAVASFIMNKTGWQPFPSFSVNMTSGYYWMKLSSPSPMSDKNDYYRVYMKDQPADGLIARAREAYLGPGFQRGWSIVSLRNQNGTVVGLSPYQQVLLHNSNVQEFVANQESSFNTVFLWLSDRIYNPVNATILVRDVTTNSSTLASGILSQQAGHGLEGWVPISLNAVVTTTPGDTYSLEITEPNNGYSWMVALRGVTTDPPSAGFQGQGSFWLFQLGFLSWPQGNLDWGDVTTNGVDALTTGYLDAVRIRPSTNETLNSMSILMGNNFRKGNYTSGQMSVSVWDSYPSGLTPFSQLSNEVSVQAPRIPTNGWLNMTGINQPLLGGRDYWVVFSSNSSEPYSFARFTNSFAFDVMVSLSGGLEWQEPREGPTDWGFVATLSNQSIGTFVSGRASIHLTSSGYFADPFTAVHTAQITGVYLQGIPGCTPLVSINRDTGSGYPSLLSIASGIFSLPNASSTRSGFIQLSSVANILAGEKYWLVIHPLSGICNISPLVYLPNAPNEPPDSPSVVSNNYGFTWAKASNGTSSLVYILASPGRALPKFDTAEMVGFLNAAHSPSVSEGLIRGWTGYVASSELSEFGQVASWLDNQTGKGYFFYGRGQPNVLNQLQAKNDVIVSSGISSQTCSGLLDAIVSELPFMSSQFVNVDDRSQLETCATSLGPVLHQLDYMLGPGVDFGHTARLNVLVIGDGLSDNIRRYLSVAYNTTYVQLILDPNVAREGNLSRYSAIIWSSSADPFVNQSGAQVENYVLSGGNLILLRSGENRTGFDSLYSSLNNTYPGRPAPGPGLLQAILKHTSFAGLSVRNSTTELYGNSTDLIIDARSYGQGLAFFIWFSQSDAYQVSSPATLLSNLISASAGLPPPLWLDSTSILPSVDYNIMRVQGNVLLIWFVNNGSESASIMLHVNGTRYGVGPAWKTVDMNSLNITKGSGSDVVIHAEVPAGAWVPIYVVSSSSAALIDYSNIQIDGQSTYPGQSYFKLKGSEGQQVLVLISSNTTATQLLVNDTLSLPNIQSQAVFNESPSGWLYKTDSNTILVKFTSAGAATLRFIAYSKPLQPSPVLPVRTLAAFLIALFCVELGALVLVSLMSRPGEPSRSDKFVFNDEKR